MDLYSKVVVFALLSSVNILTAAPRTPRLSLAARSPSYYFSDVDGVPGTYSFGYDVIEPDTGNTQFRTEEKYPNGTVVGSYGYIDPRGRSQRFDYIADEKGFRLLNVAPTRKTSEYVEEATEAAEPTVTWTRPRKPSTRKDPIKTPSIILEPPRFSSLD